MHVKHLPSGIRFYELSEIMLPIVIQLDIVLLLSSSEGIVSRDPGNLPDFKIRGMNNENYY